MKLPLWLKLGSLMSLQYFILTVNMLGVQHTNYAAVFTTDILISALGFTILKEMIEASTWAERIAYSLGGAGGAQVAMFFFHSH
jgi:hypothetical protein